MQSKIVCSLVVLISMVMVVGSGFIACDNDNTVNGVEPSATVKGTLQLPAVANGKAWAAILDNDVDGDNGWVAADSGLCGSGMAVDYTISEAPEGTYYFYGVVFAASDGSQGPQAGDFVGIYGGTYPDDVPSQPNVSVPATGTVTFDIDLFRIPCEITSGKWTATLEFGGLDFVVNTEGTYITEITYKFSNFRCGSITMGGSITVGRTPGWPITDGEFEIETDLDPDPFSDRPIEIIGSFNEICNGASGTWRVVVNTSTCSGTWQAVPPGK